MSVVAEIISFLDINEYQEFSGNIPLLESLSRQILTYWLRNTEYTETWVPQKYGKLKQKRRNSLLHTVNNIPSEESWMLDYPMSCTRKWHKFGVYHRETLPAIERGNYPDSIREWLWMGKPHRDNDLPAFDGGDLKVWCQHGRNHRNNGLPAVVEPDYLEWWFCGRLVRKIRRNYVRPESVEQGKRMFYEKLWSKSKYDSKRTKNT